MATFGWLALGCIRGYRTKRLKVLSTKLQMKVYLHVL